MIRPTFVISLALLSTLLIPAMGQCSDYGLGRIILPEYMEAITSMQVLVDSLKSSSSSSRLYAVKRMTQLRNPEAIPFLVEAIGNEPPRGGIDSPQGLRYYSVIAIGQIGGPDAESYILGLAEALHKGDSIPGIPPGLDYMYTVYGTHRGLAELGSAKCMEFLFRIYSDPNVGGQYRSSAYASYKRVVLKEARFATPKDSLYYIVDELRNAKVTANYVSPGIMSDEFIRSNGLQELIVEYGQDYPEILEKYSSTIPSDDNFLAELDTLIQTVKERIKREGKRREFIEKGWLE